ncbi:MAG: PH domain-containing protein [Candidatus Gracilibacteria bacterium]|nr:PH domain-containing protein [Candidatus Gracilibacteria bacterium]
MSLDIQGIDITSLKNTFRPGEQLKLVFKRHWIVYAHLAFYVFILIVSSLLFVVYSTSIFSFTQGSIFSIFLILYWSIYLLFLYVTWINNELDLFIITDQRIRGIEQISFLNRTISECSLDDIKEVNAQTKGLLENLFNFGTVSIHTASDNSHFIMHFAPEPIDSASVIRNIIQENKTKRVVKNQISEDNISDSSN